MHRPRHATIVVTTNESGDYVASPLKIGNYQVTVEKAGFKKAVAGPITVNVQSRVSNDFTLEVGQPDEIVNVKATAPLLETETSDLGQVIDKDRIVISRSTAATTRSLRFSARVSRQPSPARVCQTSYGFSSNGARALQNNFLLDGVDNNSNLR